MEQPAVTVMPPPEGAGIRATDRGVSCTGALMMQMAAAGIPLSLLWDFSWESTVGIDQAWAPAHAATYLAIALAGVTGLMMAFRTTRQAGVRLGPCSAPIGAWLALWGALLFPAAFVFDRWWQFNYGLAAGIWHPPQILKAVAFFAIVVGAWLLAATWQNRGVRGGSVAFAIGGGFVLALISVVTLTSIYPNRQHSGAFYEVACATYPLVLVALCSGGKVRWSATGATTTYMAVICAMVWLLPLFPAKPQVAPIYNALDHMMPPPFPLLLILPAAGIDALLRKARSHGPWLQAVAAGVVFFVIFAAVQWIFAEFLLSDMADNRFFAGGGKHWPFFLKIDPVARVQFWGGAKDELGFVGALISIVLAALAARLGLAIADWMKRIQR